MIDRRPASSSDATTSPAGHLVAPGSPCHEGEAVLPGLVQPSPSLHDYLKGCAVRSGTRRVRQDPGGADIGRVGRPPPASAPAPAQHPAPPRPLSTRTPAAGAGSTPSSSKTTVKSDACHRRRLNAQLLQVVLEEFECALFIIEPIPPKTNSTRQWRGEASTPRRPDGSSAKVRRQQRWIRRTCEQRIVLEMSIW